MHGADSPTVVLYVCRPLCPLNLTAPSTTRGDPHDGPELFYRPPRWHSSRRWCSGGVGRNRGLPLTTACKLRQLRRWWRTMPLGLASTTTKSDVAFLTGGRGTEAEVGRRDVFGGGPSCS